MHLFYCIDIIIEIYVSRPREYSVRDDVVIWAKRGKDSPENREDPHKGKNSDKDRDETIFTLLIIAIFLALDYSGAHLRSSLKTTRR